MKKKNGKKMPEDLSFWQSYSDMMAALLLVFVLIIAFTISAEKKSIQEQKDELEQHNKEIVELQNQLLLQAEQLEIQTTEYEEAQQIMVSQQEKIDKIIGVRTDLVEALKLEFENSGMALSVDPETGSIIFDSSLLFDYNMHVLKADGIAFLNEFFPKYFEVILSDKYREYIAEVIIEGHTDDQGQYLYNLELSQKRALAVAEYCLGERNGMFGDDEIDSIRELVTANGRSYYELIYNEDGTVNQEASRRVEVKFRLTEEEMIQEMSEILSNE